MLAFSVPTGAVLIGARVFADHFGVTGVTDVTDVTDVIAVGGCRIVAHQLALVVALFGEEGQ